MVPPSNPQAAALLAHVVSRVEQDVNFLISQNYLVPADASLFLQRLKQASPSASWATSTPTPRATPPAPAPRARAKWAYNENGSEPDDLSFSAGDVIDIVEETNPDWWTGKVNGKQALFRRATLRRSRPHTRQRSPLPRPRVRCPSVCGHEGEAGIQIVCRVVARPAPGAGSVNSVGLQQDAGQEQKKSKFGKYGNTMAHSAAGGVGAAIGGGWCARFSRRPLSRPLMTFERRFNGYFQWASDSL
ncbi:hypothetical protein BD626DRAFT_496399 [Schizophyllum amplum]|uniref:SH3 domain-containing protein n=1 Tax=Schizophyllum amplum TaxID=97359 RepID=A0A550CFA7_9AGAR|nr:hypothetical protein BD626DRAFT_496399 [Auriculariopsis ampla]